jgi:ABC-type nitrate/sulfonate/bicarbonate transport system substrate-binding protein
LIIRNDLEIQNILKLKNMKIGIKYGTSTHAAFLNIMGEGYNLINLSPDIQLNALASEEIDALAASEPTPSIAEFNKIGKEFIKLENKTSRYPVFIVMRKDFLNKHKSEIHSFLKIIDQACNKAQNHPIETASTISEVTNIDRKIILNSIKFHEYNLENPFVMLEELHDLSAFLMKEKRINTEPDWDSIIYKQDNNTFKMENHTN